MKNQVSFTLRGRNPDVLTCIANLSNDEVFTPPEFANRMLDTLAEAWAVANNGANIWADSSVRFLDPFTKSGVFLREITSLLTKGLATEILDLQQRVDHILTRQVFGIGITNLTSLLARRSVDCSKHANGPHSIAKAFATETGNIGFERMEHTWVDRSCSCCGASKGILDRGEGMESHAYAFIHADDIQARISELFGGDMQFDVIIGNPPYQLADGGGNGTSAIPIYNKFVEQAKKLNPRYLTMVIPSRWFTGGKGLDEFRESMLTDNRLVSIDDYLIASDVFPGVALKGGICYFLWDRDNPAPCRVTAHFKDEAPSVTIRPLLEPGTDVFVRWNTGLSILKKVVAVESRSTKSLRLPEGKRFEKLVSSRRPFGLDSTFKGKVSKGGDDVLIYQNGGSAYTPRSSVRTGPALSANGKSLLASPLPAPGTRTPIRTRLLVRRSLAGQAPSLRKPTFASVHSPRRARLRARYPISPVG